ncbi:hypothetical protein JN11_00089 [Mucilaginibacter frigoritolerans]|jgi:hypothetical protein|uniref:Uncharacterized protein n=1 Tax=Mucilaginibacter frigoritolerans TaxID=652788 RepID=A0A562UH51_9SPHI|nr:hypothetical protein [Mucilaginibacter frigoritolerans]TWJ04381.1 hypothetical protein JN11_00089 [Mucilaginibacter frigoritolerans]
MKFKNAPKTARQLLAIGLLLTALSGIINDFIHIPDFFRGFMAGIGLGLEIMGIILLRKGNKSSFKSRSNEATLND